MLVIVILLGQAILLARVFSGRRWLQRLLRHRAAEPRLFDDFLANIGDGPAEDVGKPVSGSHIFPLLTLVNLSVSGKVH